MRLLLVLLLAFGQVKVERVGRVERWTEVEESTMAIKRWVSTDGNMNTAASWYPSGILTNGDSIYFDGTSQVSVAVADTTRTILRCWTQSEYGGDLGAPGNAMALKARNIVHQGTGSFYYDFALDGSSSIQYVIVDSPNMLDAFTLVGTDGSSGLLYLTMACLSGKSKIITNSNIVLGWLLVGPGRNVRPIVDVGLVSAVGFYRQSGGYVTTKTPLGANAAKDRAIIDGGTLVYDVEGTGTWQDVEITGGRFEYNGTGTLTSCTVSSGVLDMNQDARAKTISKLILVPGSDFVTHDAVAVTKLIDLRPKYPLLEVVLP